MSLALVAGVVSAPTAGATPTRGAPARSTQFLQSVSAHPTSIYAGPAGTARVSGYGIAPSSPSRQLRTAPAPVRPKPPPPPGPASGLVPADLASAYRLPITAGRGQTVALVDAYDSPSAESDLAYYRAAFSLPACTTANGCFGKVNQSGTKTSYPVFDAGWALEIALDVDMVSATCPNCKILLVEANSTSGSDLGAAENTAVRLGATEVSNSWGGRDFAGSDAYSAPYFNHPGVPITASSGDGGFGAQWPAVSRYVIAVGGTSLSRSQTTRGWSETAWSGAGSGCSIGTPKPAWQHDSGCATRMEADVSAVADPHTPVAVYQTTGTGANNDKGWSLFGGTSAAAPIIAGVYALAANGATGAKLYATPSGLFDVTSGSNGTCSPAYFCTAGAGYDGPTGLGSPNGVGAF